MKEKLLLLMATMLCVVNASGYDFAVQNSDKNIYYTILSPTEVKVTSGTYNVHYTDEIIIPAEVTYDNVTYTVTEIDNKAFYGCSTLTSVSIPNTVTNIGESAFDGCSTLTSVTIPNSVTNIGKSAFYGCSTLTSVTIEDSGTSTERSGLVIGYMAFYDCEQLATINLPSPIKSIDSFAFNNTLLYKDQSNWIDEVWFIDKCLIAAKPAKSGAYNIPDDTKVIAAGAFSGCKNLTSVTIPNTITNIDTYTFNGCEGLKSIVIPSSVSSIGNSSFSGCKSLVSITIENNEPSSIQYGSQPFQNVPTTCIVYVPKNSVEDYKGSEVWGNFNIQAIPVYTLNDATVYTEKVDHNNIDIEYVRNFTNNQVWQCLYVPFDMSYDEWRDKAKVAELTAVHEYDDDDDGVIDRTVLEYRTVTEGGYINPNIPYLIKPFETGSITFSCSEKHIAAAPAVDGSVECSTTRKIYTLHGTYTGFAAGELSNIGAYVIGANGFGRATSNAALSPQRFYMLITEKQGGYSQSNNQQRLPQRVQLMVDGDTTGIEDIIIEPQDGLYYDLQGRTVQNPSAGIFIHNGKKTYIK